MSKVENFLKGMHLPLDCILDTRIVSIGYIQKTGTCLDIHLYLTVMKRQLPVFSNKDV